MSEPIGFMPPRGSRIAVVGACGGIGGEILTQLVAGGCEVIALDLESSLAQAPPPVPHTIAIDGRDAASVEAAFAHLGQIAPRLDGLVLASGYAGQRAPIGEWAVEDIDDILSGNLRLMTLVLRASLQLLSHGDPASVVMLTSDMAYIPQAGYAPYVAAKAGMVAMGRSVAREVAPTIRINFVSPGAVDTPFLRGGRGRALDPSAPLRFNMDAYLKQIPLARMAVAADVAGPVLFLLGPASSYMTGEVLHISGGAFMG